MNISDFNSIYTSIMTSAVGDNTPFAAFKAFVTDELENFSITEAQKAEIMAGAMANMAASVTNNAMQVALQAGLEFERSAANVALLQKQVDEIDSRISVSTSQKSLIDQQKLTEVQQTTVAANQATLLTSQKSELDSRKALIDQQKLTEVQQTLVVTATASKQSDLLQAEVELKSSQKGYVDQQKTELSNQSAKDLLVKQAEISLKGAQEGAISTQLSDNRKIKAMDALAETIGGVSTGGLIPPLNLFTAEFSLINNLSGLTLTSPTAAPVKAV